ncbi:MAG: uptake lipoprotein-like protein [Bryobacterales bacterium]|nr:uptake lipoprotein-like protein [Bryobacterales bacterium]
MQRRHSFFVVIASTLAVLLLCGFGFPFRRKKYETPISKDTLQPDKVLFDRAIKNIEKGNYEVARLTLNTMINTYDTSEFLAKAKLAIADSWYREGGSHGLAQAEAEYKDFILFYPNMEESAESQYKVCQIHYKQMEKADRDSSQAIRTEDECRQVLVQFPNSKFAKNAEQLLRNAQEVLADKGYRAGDFYHHKGSFPAAASRFTFVTSQYPLYSAADEAYWQLADSYKRMGDRFESQEADALSKIVKEYPLSEHVDGAKERLTAMKRAIPEADPASYARMKYELENRHKAGTLSKVLGVMSGKPDTGMAAKMGAPAMAAVRPAVPVSVPVVAAGGATGVSDVAAGVVSDTSQLDQAKDARLSSQNGVVGAAAQGTGENKASQGSNGESAATGGAAQVVPPTNHPATAKQIKQYEQMQKKATAKAAKDAKKKGIAAPAAPAAAVPAAAVSGTPAPAATPAAKPQQ